VTASAVGNGLTVTATHSATVTIIDLQPAIEISKTADPADLLEPGGMVTFTTQITNTTAETITLVSLADDIYGNLHQQGDCNLPQTITGNGYYACGFSTVITGTVGYSETNTVTATVQDDEANTVQASDHATVTIIDALPSIDTSMIATPTQVAAPGDWVTFTVRVTNTSTTEALTITNLIDDVYGNLDSQGNCAILQEIAVGSFYECSFVGFVIWNANAEQTNTVTATAEDDEANSTSAQASTTITVTGYVIQLPLINK
jgi:hypothetical protein